MGYAKRKPPPRRAVEWLINTALNAHRHGHVPALPARARRLNELAEQPWLRLIWGTLGDRLPADRRWSDSARLLLAWALTQLRPDRQPRLDGIAPDAWTQSTAWRPMLALACQYGFLTVPEFPGVYRRRPGEPVADNLCGLWAVGPSTLYRYLDKGRRLLADLLGQPQPNGDQLLAFRDFVDQSHGPKDGMPLADWHASQAREAVVRESAEDALWHFWHAGLWDECTRTLKRFALELASGTEVDALLRELCNGNPPLAMRFDLAMAEAPLWRYRRNEQQELVVLQMAMRIADELDDPIYKGRANAGLALFDQNRDPDKAITRFEVSIEQLLSATQARVGTAHSFALGEYAHSLIHLAWLHLRRNDPKAKPLLGTVTRMREESDFPESAAAFLELALGEQCRCEGQMDQAIAHRLRALLLYEQIGDRRSIVNCHNNLCLLYAQTGAFSKAHKYGQLVLAAAARYAVEPELVANARGNMGLAFLYAGAFDDAIAEFNSSRDAFFDLGMRRHLVTVHLNLAEAHFKRFKAMGDSIDEALGDEHASVAQTMGKELDLPSVVESIHDLKRGILGSTPSLEQLVPPERAAHPQESAEIDRLRTDLALPRPAAQRARTHLALSRQYLLIAAKEREAAQALMAKQALNPADFRDEFEALRSAWERELTREQQLATLWRERVGELVTDAQRRALVAQLLAQGALSKSAYAETAQVSPATASKHLGVLAEKGLLVQTGKGPSTRYVLPG